MLYNIRCGPMHPRYGVQLCRTCSEGYTWTTLADRTFVVKHTFFKVDYIITKFAPLGSILRIHYSKCLSHLVKFCQNLTKFDLNLVNFDQIWQTKDWQQMVDWLMWPRHYTLCCVGTSAYFSVSLPAELRFTAELLFPSQCDCGMIFADSVRIRWCGTGGFPEQGQRFFIVQPSPFSSFTVSISLLSFYRLVLWVLGLWTDAAFI